MPAPGPRRGQRAAERNARIWQAAAAIFARDGYERTTMQAIASRAELSVGLLYRYAPSKEALFAASFERVAQAAFKRLGDQLESAGGVDAELRVGQAWLGDELAHGQWPAMTRQAWLVADASPPIGDALERPARDLDELATSWAHRAVGGDPTRTLDAQSLAQAARLLLDGAIGHVTERRSPGQEWAVARAAAALLRTALVGAAGHDPHRPPVPGRH